MPAFPGAGYVPDSSSTRRSSMASLHDFQMESITGETVDLSSYAGKVCLVVNVASA